MAGQKFPRVVWVSEDGTHRVVVTLDEDAEPITVSERCALDAMERPSWVEMGTLESRYCVLERALLALAGAPA